MENQETYQDRIKKNIKKKSISQSIKLLFVIHIRCSVGNFCWERFICAAVCLGNFCWEWFIFAVVCLGKLCWEPVGKIL
jgi:hypothetical protein